MQLALSHFDAVNFGFEQGSEHGNFLSLKASGSTQRTMALNGLRFTAKGLRLQYGGLGLKQHVGVVAAEVQAAAFMAAQGRLDDQARHLHQIAQLQ